MCFLHNTFLNRDFSLDIVKKYIKLLTVILISVLEGSVSHFLYVGLQYFFMTCRTIVKIISHNFVRFIR